MEKENNSQNSSDSPIAIIDVARQPQTRPLFIFMGVILLIGTVFYHFVEGWSWLDSLYFCVVSLATVGYGDFTPTEPIGRLFTIFYLINGLAIFVSFIQVLTQYRRRFVEAEREASSEEINNG